MKRDGRGTIPAIQVIKDDVRIPGGEIDARLPVRFLAVRAAGPIADELAELGIRSRAALGHNHGSLVVPSGWELRHPAPPVTVGDWAINVASLVDDFSDHVGWVELAVPAAPNHVHGVLLFEPYLGDVQSTAVSASELVERQRAVAERALVVNEAHRALHDSELDFSNPEPSWAGVIPESERAEALASEDRGWFVAAGALEKLRADVARQQCEIIAQRHGEIDRRGLAASADPDLAVRAVLGPEPSGFGAFVWRRAAGRVMLHCERFGLEPAEFARHSRVIPETERRAFVALREGLAKAQRSVGLAPMPIPGIVIEPTISRAVGRGRARSDDRGTAHMMLQRIENVPVLRDPLPAEALIWFAHADEEPTDVAPTFDLDDLAELSADVLADPTLETATLILPLGWSVGDHRPFADDELRLAAQQVTDDFGDGVAWFVWPWRGVSLPSWSFRHEYFEIGAVARSLADLFDFEREVGELVLRSVREFDLWWETEVDVPRTGESTWRELVPADYRGDAAVDPFNAHADVFPTILKHLDDTGTKQRALRREFDGVINALGRVAAEERSDALTEFLGDVPNDAARAFVWRRAAGQIAVHLERFGQSIEELRDYGRTVPEEQQLSHVLLLRGLQNVQRSLGLPRIPLPGFGLATSAVDRSGPAR